jgi:hypothetical protein
LATTPDDKPEITEGALLPARFPLGEKWDKKAVEYKVFGI